MIVEKRVNEIINRLNKTRVERRPDLKGTYIYAHNMYTYTCLAYYLIRYTTSSTLVARAQKFIVNLSLLLRCTADKDASNAAEKAERKMQLKEKASIHVMFALLLSGNLAMQVLSVCSYTCMVCAEA